MINRKPTKGNLRRQYRSKQRRKASTDPTTYKLADSFMKLGSQCDIVNISSDMEPELPTDMAKPATVSKVPVARASQYDNGSIKTIDDINKSMTNKAIDVQHLDSRGAKDLLSNKNMDKYTGVEKFNRKSFQSGSSVGVINLNTVTN